MNVPSEGELSGPAGGSGNRIPRQLSDLQKTITMAQIAKAAGVSQGAISSLLNDRDYGIRVSDKTRERVFKVCREMGYIPNDLRAVVRMYPELGDFCLLLSSKIEGGLRDPFVHRLATAAMEAIPGESHPLNLAIYDESQDYSGDAAAPQPVLLGTYSKFLFHGVPNLSLVELLTKRGLPLVSLGHDLPLPGVTSLVPDYARASFLAIEHLVNLGHQHLGIVSGPFGSTNPKIIELNRGVSLACEKFGLPIESQSIVYGDLSEHAGQSALEEFLHRSPSPTAVFAMSDTSALAVQAAAQARGLHVPSELTIVGCGNDPSAQLGYPKLTTIHLPAEEMAADGVHEVDRLVKEGGPDAPRKIVLPVRLVVRDSCGTRLMQKV